MDTSSVLLSITHRGGGEVDTEKRVPGYITVAALNQRPGGISLPQRTYGKVLQSPDVF